jgi:hypothetical protein
MSIIIPPISWLLSVDLTKPLISSLAGTSGGFNLLFHCHADWHHQPISAIWRDLGASRIRHRLRGNRRRLAGAQCGNENAECHDCL